MSTNLNYKQVVNVARRTWDLEVYEKRAQDRAKITGSHTDGKPKFVVDGDREQMVRDGNSQEEFVPAAPGAIGPQSSRRAFLKARTNKIDSLDSKIGSVEIVNPEAMAMSKSASDDLMVTKDSGVIKSGVGWHCKVCDCFLKDSLTYLDHINGRKHQRNLGFSMRVERSTKNQINSRLEAMVKAKERSSKFLATDQFEEDEEHFNEIVKAKDEELKRRQEERKRERKERKRKKKAQKNIASETESRNGDEKDQTLLEEANEEGNDGGLDPNIAAMMGFSGFGGGK